MSLTLLTLSAGIVDLASALPATISATSEAGLDEDMNFGRESDFLKRMFI
jgi:hypothetical protein